jgi:hypothetical protein
VVIRAFGCDFLTLLFCAGALDRVATAFDHNSRKRRPARLESRPLRIVVSPSNGAFTPAQGSVSKVVWHHPVPEKLRSVAAITARRLPELVGSRT